jgi:hypothetical protein
MVALAIACLGVCAVAPVQAQEATAVTLPAKQMEAYMGRIQGKEAQIAYLPAMQLRWAVRSKATATGGVFRKHKSSKEILAPFDQAVLERVLAALQDDLAERFRAAGWQARTAAELGSDVPQLKTLKTNAELGVPVLKLDNTVNAQDFVVVSLPGRAPVDTKAISNGMAIQRFLKGKQGLNASIVYEFAPGTVAPTSSSSAAATTASSAPSIWRGPA